MQLKTRILIVDDEISIRDVLSRHLGAEGYQCTTAENGEEALALLDKETFDAVLCDIMMPGISGLQVLEEVKRRDPLALVIMVSAVTDPTTSLEAITEMGAYSYLYKPFDLEEVSSALGSGLSWKQEQGKNLESAENPAEAVSETITPPGEKILIVDDESSVREILSRHLDAEGYQCTTAESGEEALAVLDKETFDAVLCDITMPGICGLQVLEEVKRRDPLALVIMVSAVIVSAPVVQSVVKAGAYGYVFKPFNLEDLTSTLSNALNWKKEQEA